MIQALFTVNLTRGAYVVKEQDAHTLLDAVANNVPHALVEADILGDGLYFSPVRIVVAHIVSVVQSRQEYRPDVAERGLAIATREQNELRQFR